MHESSAFDMIMDEGIRKGKIEEGHRLLLLLAQDRFGAPNWRTEGVVKAIQDLERLERMAKAIFTVKSWKELLNAK